VCGELPYRGQVQDCFRKRRIPPIKPHAALVSEENPKKSCRLDAVVKRFTFMDCIHVEGNRVFTTRRNIKDVHLHLLPCFLNKNQVYLRAVLFFSRLGLFFMPFHKGDDIPRVEVQFIVTSNLAREMRIFF